ncbi:MAG: RNA pyrophosphohydrolase [Hyphomicrobiaceae bacterium]
MKNKPTNVDAESLPYRPCVGIMVLNTEGRVWAGRRVKGKDLKKAPSDATAGGWWQMPQGGIDEGEDPQRAALRELEEETAITNVEIIAETSTWLTYDLPPELLGVAWKGRFRGQKQKWYAVRFKGCDSEINLIPENDKHDIEFDAWKWVVMEELVDLIVPFKRDVYRSVIDEFSHLAAR